MWDILTSLSPSTPRDRCETDVKHTSATVKSCGGDLCFFLNIHVLLLFLFFMFIVLCVLACVPSAQLWLAEAPERVKQQRDQNESVEDGREK